MASPIMFHLNACSVSSGVQARDAKCRDDDCLVHIRARPLVAASSSTDVSASAGLSLRFQAAPPPPPPVSAPIPAVAGFKLDLASLLTTSMGTAAQGGLEMVGRLAPAPVADAARALHTRIADAKPPTDLCVLIDQYEVGETDPANPSKSLKHGCSRILEVMRGVLCSNPRPVGSRWSTLLGPTGHYERFSAWSHIVGTVLFLVYAIVRLALPGTMEGAAQILTTVAAFGVVFVFFSSSVYHSTAPDATLAYYTRFLDYFSIYLGIVLTATADIAVATQGFRNVPVVTILDLPVAGTVVVFFFWWKRHRIAKEETWQDRHVPSSTEGGCILSHGLFSRGHYDLHHSQTRETTSLLLSSSYFMSVPAAVMTLEAEAAAVVLTLQAVSFVAIVSGMVLDRIVKWPNKQLVDGKHQCLACPSPHGPGCVVTSHGVWHLVALVATATTFVAREYALSSYESSEGF